jgi:hypothetical protein
MILIYEQNIFYKIVDALKAAEKQGILVEKVVLTSFEHRGLLNLLKAQKVFPEPVRHTLDGVEALHVRDEDLKLSILGVAIVIQD